MSDDTIRLFLRGTDHQYDPGFGELFHVGTWNAGFDHTQALRDITGLTSLLQANFSWPWPVHQAKMRGHVRPLRGELPHFLTATPTC